MFLLLACAEVVAISLAFSRDALLQTSALTARMVSLLGDALPLSLSMAGALLVVGLARPGALSPLLAAPQPMRAAIGWLALHVAGFALLAALLSASQAGARPFTEFATLALLGLGVAAGAAGWLLAISPFHAWRDLILRERLLILAAFAAALAALALGAAAQSFWRYASDATLELTRTLLLLGRDDVVYLPQDLIVGVEGFRVEVSQQCSGYEGVGLVISFMALFFYLFRQELRFPQALLLLPIGVAAIWISNSVRIAALILIGAELSPELAAGGFHSYAGLAMFMMVVVGLMAAALRAPFFNPSAALPRTSTPTDAARVRMADAMLAPFLVLLLSGVLVTMFAQQPQAYAGLQAGAVAATLLIFGAVYRRMDWRFSIEGALAGVAVAVIWIAAAPAEPTEAATAQAAWVAGLSETEYALWLLSRGLLFALLVPIAEELVFRGYLHRAILRREFEHAPEGAFSWRAFLVTTALFGLLHSRWWEAAIAGALFALALYRTGRLSSAILAHAVANGLIFIYVVGTGRWEAM